MTPILSPATTAVYKVRVSLRCAMFVVCTLALFAYTFVIAQRVSYCRRMAKEHQTAAADFERMLREYEPDMPRGDEWRKLVLDGVDPEILARFQADINGAKTYIKFHKTMQGLFERAASVPWLYAPPPAIPAPYEVAEADPKPKRSY